MPILRPSRAEIVFAVLKMLLTLGIAMSIAFVFRRELVRLLDYPLRAAELEPANFFRGCSPVDAIIISLTISFYVGLMAALPFLIYFSVPLLFPLTSRQEKTLRWCVASGALLFLGGVLLSIFYLAPETLRWLYKDLGQHAFWAIWNPRVYYSFVLHLCFAAGLVCELPVLLITFVAMEEFTAKALRRSRIYGYGICIVAAGLISPSLDPVMLLIFAIPIVVVFEACIWLSTYLEKRRHP